MKKSSSYLWSGTAYRAVISIFRLVVKHVEPGVLVEAGVVVGRLYGGGDVEAVGQGLQGGVPLSSVMTPAHCCAPKSQF